MELAAIVYSTLAIVFAIIFLLIIISYLGYKMKQKEEPFHNPTTMNYQNLSANTRVTSERKYY